MLASVFIMQPLGQLAAYVVAVVVLASLNHQYNLTAEDDRNTVYLAIDKFWRWVTGIGTIPAAISLVFRLTIPESGRFTLDVQEDGERAIQETRALYGPSQISLRADMEMRGISDGISQNNIVQTPRIHSQAGHVSPHDKVEIGDISEQVMNRPRTQAPTAHSPKQFSIEDLRQYFIEEGNWRYLAATSSCWFLVSRRIFVNPRVDVYLCKAGCCILRPSDQKSAFPCKDLGVHSCQFHI
jgi:PHS family inorganic phosphate transporter-like MFS transporter